MPSQKLRPVQKSAPGLQDYINICLQATFGLLPKLASKIWCHFVYNLQRYDTISAHVTKRAVQFASEKFQDTGMVFI